MRMNVVMLAIISALMAAAIAYGDTKITELPLGSAASSSTNSVLPYVDTTDNTTKKLKLSDLIHVPAFTTTYVAPYCSRFDHTPTACTAGQFAVSQDAQGNFTCSAAGGGSVTAVSVVSANGFAGSSSGGATPALTLSTTITGLLKGNGTAISAQTTGDLTDVGTDGITIGSGSGAVLGSGTTVSQHVADPTHNGYLSSTDFNTFNVAASGGVTTLAAFDSAPNANAGTISGNTLTLQPASASFPGGVSTTTQTFAGAKTFSSAPTFSTMTLGSVLVAGSGGLVVQDNSNFFYDATNHRIGLGTTSPNYKITQNGGNATATYSQWVNGTTTGTTSTDGLLVGSDASGNGVINEQEAKGFTITVNSSTGIAIDSSGRVGIGTASPVQKLDVSGSVNIATGSFLKYGNVNALFFPLSRSTMIGLTAGNAAATGDYNTGIGYSVLSTVTSGALNTAVGYNALGAIQGGGSNTAYGVNAVAANVSSGSNAGFGTNSLTAVTGANNSALGTSAGQTLVTGTTSTFVGFNADVQASGAALSNLTVIGYNAVGYQSNQVVLGNTSVSQTNLQGNVGISIPTPTSKLHLDAAGNAAYEQFTNTSTGQLVTDGLRVGIDSSGNAVVNNRENLPLTLMTNDTAALTILAGGSVGIGTTSPTSKLDISAGIRIRNLTVAGPVSTDSAGNLSSAATNSVTQGGTGAATLTNHGVLLGQGTSAIVATSVGASGTLLSGVASADPAFTATPTLGIPGATKGTLAFTGNTSGTVTIQPAAAAGTWTLTLPTDAGTSGYVLQTNGSGVTSWVVSGSGGGGSGGSQEFTAAGANNWTVPAGTTRITVSGCPAGGGGGGGGGGTGTNSGGGGGAPGLIGTIDLKVTAGDSMVFTLGTGGTSGAAGSSGAGGNGGIGGDTTITLNGTIINKYRAIQQGGNGGGATAGASVSALAGVGGNIGLAGTVGTWSTVSGIPGYGTLNSASSGGGGTDGGGGGSGGLSAYNPGGAGANGSTGSTAGVAGSAGAKCGGGGGGSGSGNSGTTGGAGGVGGDGYILISY